MKTETKTITKAKGKFSECDEKLMLLISRRSLSKGAIKNYDSVFNEIFELFGVTPSKLVEIGKREQKPFVNIETGQSDILDLEDRSVTKFQFEYYNYLKNKNLAETTIKLKLDTFKALLAEFDIVKPKAIRISIKKDRIREDEIVSWSEVETAMSYCKSMRDKAIVSFIVTTGLRRSDVLKLTIADLIKACSIYFNDEEKKTIENLLSKNPDDIIPCWEIIPSKTSKKSQLCVTFNTPESSKYIWHYLNGRLEKNIKKGEGLEESEPLFATSTKKSMSTSSLEQMFQRLNKQLGDKLDKNKKYGKFRAHSLRKLFSTTVRRNITQVVVNSDKTSEIDIVSIFTGHVPPNESNSKVYEAIESDSHDSYLRKIYTALIPYLSIQEVEVKDVKTKQYKDLEEQNRELQEKMDAQTVIMQRTMDEQKESYERKLRHLESVNSALSTQIKDIQNQIGAVSNQNNVTEIQNQIMNNETVNKFNLSNKIIELYRVDIENNNSLIVDSAYIETLIARAYNSLPSYRILNIRNDGENKQENRDYQKLKNEVTKVKDNFIQSNGFLLSQSQFNSIAEKLDDYCDKLWWKHSDDYDKETIESLILKIAKDGI
ncbi:tyrosine-type recombinase/integrase [Methanobrevibacter sp.]|uniref:tyrosine-type recombinase/integrase n=1 Tax=Methanobrevibacter sp. TaxID=66852 RepID=UPI003866D0CF